MLSVLKRLPSPGKGWLLAWLVSPIAGFMICYSLLAAASSVARGEIEQVAPAASASDVTGNMGLAEAQAFSEYPVYWLGEEFAGLRVTHIDRVYYEHPPGVGLPPSDMITIVYGDCTPHGTPPTCVRPISITTSSSCTRPQELTARAAKEGEPFSLRSATAEWVSGSLVIYAGDATVNIIAATDNPREDALAAASSLRSMNALGATTASHNFSGARIPCGGGTQGGE